MTELTENQVVMQGMTNEDKATKTKTIYDVDAGEIFWRNLLAGFSRALGGMLIYGVFLVISLYTFSAFVMPALQPLFSAYIQGMNSIQQLNNNVQGAKNTLNATPVNNNGQSIQDLLKQLQNGQQNGQ